MRGTLRIAWPIMVTAFGKRRWTTGKTRMMRAPLRCQRMIVAIGPAAQVIHLQKMIVVVIEMTTEMLVASEAGRVQGRDTKAAVAGEDAAKAKCPSRSRWSNRRQTW